MAGSVDLTTARPALADAAGRPPAVPVVPQQGSAPTEEAPPAPAAAAQPGDEAWLRAFGHPALGPYSLVAAVDGDDVYVGGDFSYAVAGTANDTFLRIARWDGTGLLPLGAGLDGAVRAIAVVGTDVYVGGDFLVAGGRTRAPHLARWDGAAWHDVAGGVTDPDRSYGTTVEALVSDGRTLWVGGTFTRAGEAEVRSLAALDLATGTWSDAGGGVASSWSTEPATVHALALLRGRLLVGGSFDRAGEVETSGVAALDPAGGWTAFGAGVTDEGMHGVVHALAVDDATGTAYLGGSFTAAGEVRAWNVAALRDGAFAAIGDATSYGGKHAQVGALAVAGGVLYAGGSFTGVGGSTAQHLARYDGTDWSVVGDGVDNVVHALAATPDGGVVVLGDFTGSGERRVVHGGVWTGTAWRTLGQGVSSDPYGGGTVHAVVPDGAGAFVGGLFDQAGEVRAGSVARYEPGPDGGRWDPLAGGVTSTYGHGQVFAMVRLGEDLVVCGSFQTAGGVVCNHIARWDGEAWHPLGEGLDDPAYAMVVLGGKLYVGGSFGTAGRVQAGHLARWDPATSTWEQVGGSPTYDHDIRALAAIGDRYLVVGGTFTRFFSGGTTIVEGLWGMALHDTQAPVVDVLSGYLLLEGTSRYGAPGWVHALEVVGEDLVVGGWFDVAGIMALGDRPSPGFACPNAAVWHFGGDGSWEALGRGTDHQVTALEAVGGSVAVGGWFTRAGDVAAARVALHDLGARRWSPLGSGLSDGARGASWALALAQDAASGLWVGGEFPVAGAQPSDNLALWTATRG